MELAPSVLPIVSWPDKRLTVVCVPVTEFDNGLKQLSLDLFATMKVHDGVGLAAPQVGVSIRVCGIWIPNLDPIVLINPEITERSEELFEWEEGCLSVLGYFEKRKRPMTVVIKFQDVDGNWRKAEFSGLASFAAQHEIDHLDGKLFIDGASNFKRTRIKNKMKKYLRKK